MLSETALFIFDFDQTLVWTPCPEDGEKTYLEHTGRPWPYPGWWGRPESLMPPVLPLPADQNLLNHDVADKMRAAYDDPAVKVIVLTGRHVGLHKHICRILRDLGIDFIPDHEVICKGGPFATVDFKMEVVKEWATKMPGLRRVDMWDDREVHVTAFRQELGPFLKQWRNIDTTIHLVKPAN